MPGRWDPEVELLGEDECRRLISAGGVGRLAYSGRRGMAVLPVRYKLDQGSIVFRTAFNSPTDEDLRTGIEGAEYKVSFEVDELGQEAQEGWVVFIQGAAHHMDCESDTTREHFLRITPTLIVGRRLRRH